MLMHLKGNICSGFSTDMFQSQKVILINNGVINACTHNIRMRKNKEHFKSSPRAEAKANTNSSNKYKFNKLSKPNLSFYI